jgi:hypothetical protein
MEVVTVRVDEKTREELEQVVEELGGSTGGAALRRRGDRHELHRLGGDRHLHLHLHLGPALHGRQAQIDGRKYRVLLEQMLRVDMTKLNNWIGVLDDHEMDARDDALRLYHGLL